MGRVLVALDDASHASHDPPHGQGLCEWGDVHTQTIEGWFGNVKNGIAGNYHGVSVKWLQSYVNEYTWRYNHRYNGGRSMFAELLRRAVVVEP